LYPFKADTEKMSEAAMEEDVAAGVRGECMLS
jgi:hypothetical protein